MKFTRSGTMKDKNPREVCEQFNKVRMELVGRRYSSEQMVQIVKEKCDLGKSYFWEMVKQGFFEKSTDSKRTSYMFPYSPVHQSKFEQLFKNFRKRMRDLRRPETNTVITGSDIDKAISLLKKEGYIILRNDGIDESKLKAEMPEVYNKYKIMRQL